MDTQDTLGLVALSLEKEKPVRDCSKRRANRRKNRPTNQKTVAQSTSHAAPGENVFTEVPSVGSYTSKSRSIEDSDLNTCLNPPQVSSYQPGPGSSPINQPVHTNLPLRYSLSTVSNRSGQVPFVQQSYLHSEAQPSVQPEPSKIGRWSEAANIEQSSAPCSVLRPHRPEDRNTYDSPPRKSLVRDPLTHLPTPTPTPTYVTIAHATPAILPSPQSLLLVFDLNGTLLHRASCNVGRSKDYTSRPFLNQFLQYAFANHSILIWSSARPASVKGMCGRLFKPAQRNLLVGQWARDTLGLTPAQYKDRVQVYKRLDRIWDDEKLQNKHPSFDKGERWGQHNTVLIDDSLLKASAQPYNHIEVPVFVKGSETNGDGRDILAQVAGYLEEARRWNDVSAFMREKRFTVDAGWKWAWTDSGEEKENRKKKKEVKEKDAGTTGAERSTPEIAGGEKDERAKSVNVDVDVDVDVEEEDGGVRL
ncbi:hypothetical protein N7G274_010265 [Stereocaulon virgatum]|uniref:Mitochondrial import inner membrane translocase subunit TIM50 n=1 Tax=Stereocaulon virgatum TaxID=373712 RepID=A0ABR3ZTW1_9LECA